MILYKVVRLTEEGTFVSPVSGVKQTYSAGTTHTVQCPSFFFLSKAYAVSWLSLDLHGQDNSFILEVVAEDSNVFAAPDHVLQRPESDSEIIAFWQKHFAGTLDDSGDGLVVVDCATVVAFRYFVGGVVAHA